MPDQGGEKPWADIPPKHSNEGRNIVTGCGARALPPLKRPPFFYCCEPLALARTI